MKIVKLVAENVKRIVAVEITPDGHVVVVGGANAAGKTSVLDALMYAIAGKSLIPDEPLRRGQKKGHVTIKLDGDNPLTIKRTFTAKGTTSLKVTTADGSTPASPQALLDSLCGRIAFDPLEFTRLSPAKQAETLRGLVGLNFTEHDAKRLKVFAERTIINRDVRSTEAKLDVAPRHDDTPEEEVSVVSLTHDLEEAQDANRAKGAAEEQVRCAEQHVAQVANRSKVVVTAIEDLKRQIAKHNLELTQLGKERDEVEQRVSELSETAAAFTTVECQPILNRIAKSDEVNSKIRQNAERKRLAAELNSFCGKADYLTEQLDELDASKQRDLESADWPIEGLGFGDDGVTFSGLPFEQASSAEQLRTSVAVGMAGHPELRVMLIRDGSLLDEDNFAMIGTMAAEADFQLWIERVGEGAECSVIIEDGMVKQEPDDADE